MSNNSDRTNIEQLGEFGLIDRITKSFSSRHPETVLGVGDDAAIVQSGEEQMVITSDMLLEGIHFDLAYMPLEHLGYKAVAVNISDVAAMNAIPKQITVNLGLSNRFSVEAVEALYQGISYACENYKVDLVGGDTTSSASGLVISVTAVGFAPSQLITRRSTVQENDIVCVTGDLGGAYLGLQILAREKQVYLDAPDQQPQLDKYNYVVRRQLRPEARMDLVYELRDLGIVPTAMIDISDGLASELFHLSKQSGVGFRIFEENIPYDQQTYETAVEFQLSPITCALNGGEDYELLFTISQADYEKIKNQADIHSIGYAQKQEGGLQLATKAGQLVDLQAQGWNHFNGEE
ncbi:thiamine-phosphate kinase [Tunicatimonas pelagia]|uniref:thiamine-phosphate kinase n=1 Tax=Tunicatimonas pelagia TaxID=931531 RepID=UPI002664FC3A|nr:thiamine-phosphate kinase [Tunicatimonas pelagia]WKN42814.1 thiamine-phosphate kinase [Tunicatimonas pelagia]